MELRQNERAVTHGRAPEQAPGHRTREAEEGINDSVIETRHAPHLGDEWIDCGGERHEHQPLPRGVGPRHRTAQQEGLGFEVLLRRAGNMGCGGSIVQFLVVVETPTDDAIPDARRMRGEEVEIMHPLLHRNEAPASGIAGGGHGVVSLGILGAILVAREITAIAKAKAVDHALDPERIGHLAFDGTGVQEDVTGILSPHPCPQVRLRRRHLAAGARECRKGHVSRDGGSQPREEPRTKTDHRAEFNADAGEITQHHGHRHVPGTPVELQKSGMGRDAVEDPGLGTGHGHEPIGMDRKIKTCRDRASRYDADMPARLSLDARTARRLLLHLQGLGESPGRKLGRQGLLSLIQRMGFVQLDSISTVERAHHLTLHSRNRTYRREDLAALLESERRLFEHWTHDASAIPLEWYAYWKPRFARMAANLENSSWFRERIGDDPAHVIARVLDRIAARGPTMSRELDGEAGGQSEPWWGWKPAKAALEYLWWKGAIQVVRRQNFQKVYDLTERVIPGHVLNLDVSAGEHLDWACSSALDRLGTATPGEIAAFWNAVSPNEARQWVEANRHRLMTIEVQGVGNGASKNSLAWTHIEGTLAQLSSPPSTMRFLSPFDPVLRDRRRALRLFGFDYRFEAFVPRAKRRYGYYVLPILEGDRLTGRASMKFHRSTGELAVEGLWWEPGVVEGKGRRTALATALARLGRFLGATSLSQPSMRSSNHA